MSHDTFTATLPDGVVLHGEYDGTCDVYEPLLYPSADEVWAAWRKQDHALKCTGDAPGCKIVLVDVHCNYGGGWDERRRVCLTHRCLISLTTDDCLNCRAFSAHGDDSDWDPETGRWTCEKHSAINRGMW